MSVAGSTALDLFRYKSDENRYEAGQYLGDTNWWELGNQIQSYGALGTWGLFALT